MPSSFCTVTTSGGRRLHADGAARTRRHRLLALALVPLLGACQSLSPLKDSGAPIADPLASAPPIERGLDAAGLSSLLLAEFAGQRGDYRRAAEEYLSQAERYQRPALAERAALAARFSNDPLLIEETVARWQRLAPDAEAPTRLRAGLALQRGNWSEALTQRLRLIERGVPADLAGLAELAIASEAPLAELRDQLSDFLADAAALPQRHEAELALAMLEAATGRAERADDRLASLAREHPELPAVWLTRAQLALDAAEPRRARQAAQRGLAIAPDDPRFVLLLAQAELALGNVRAAEARTDALLGDHSDGDELRLALAQLYLEQGHPQPARRLLLPLTRTDTPPPSVYYLLGAIAEEEGATDNALLYYRQVAPGDEFLAARVRAAQMLIANDRLADARAFLRSERLEHPANRSRLIALEVELLDEQGYPADASALLDRGLAAAPDDAELLYLRAMRAWQRDDLDAMERDLQRIIARNPDHATALNALGYTLIDLGDTARFNEARELIERAHRLAPNNPAILDSLGWLYFRLGEPARALPWLERAWMAMPDQEVAAHLAEVLWTLNRRAEARALVAEALARFEERPVLDALLERIPALAPDAPSPDEI